MSRKRLLLVSGVLPFPGAAGQEERVANKLRGFDAEFDVTFLTFAPSEETQKISERLEEYCHSSIVLEAIYAGRTWKKIPYWIDFAGYTMRTGLRKSNFVLNQIELSPDRVLSATQDKSFDCAVFEYWHAHRAAAALRSVGVPSVLDMHNLLWRSYQRQLANKGWIPASLRSRAVDRYKSAERNGWRDFDALISINREEDRYAKSFLGEGGQVFFTPMGVDTSHWSYGPAPSEPQRIAYFGALGNRHNQQSVVDCFEQVMPMIWASHPETELWIVGSNPPASIRELERIDPRVHVTGFIEDPRETLKTMSAVLCPWRGRYGFRSRIVQVMALGVPVIANEQAIDGMDLSHEHGLLVAEAASEMARESLRILQSPEFARQQGRLAREAIETTYSFDSTYGRLTAELVEWLHKMQEGAS